MSHTISLPKSGQVSNVEFAVWYGNQHVAWG